MSLNTFCQKAARYICEKSNKEEQETVLTFGLEIIFSELLKLFILLMVGVMLNELLPIMVIVITFSSFRIISGGVHLETFSACLITTLVSIIGLTYLSVWLAKIVTVGMTLIYILATLILGLYLILKRVPVGNQKQDRFPKEKVLLFKKVSSLLLVSLIIGCLSLTIFIVSLVGKLIVISTLAGLNLQFFTLLPIGEKLFLTFDRKFSFKSSKLKG